MTKERLYKYLRGETTGEERESVLRWINASPENMQTFRAMRSVCDAILCSREELVLDTKVATRAPRRPKHIVAAAAVALCACMCGASYLFRPEPVTLKETITLNSVDVISTLAGQRSELTLADGTHVWLGSNSRLYLSPDGDSRRIALEGEAFFNVTKDSICPFVVDTKGRSVTVYGTEFNVSAYPGATDMSVQLYRGSVAVLDTAMERTVELIPGKQAEFGGKAVYVSDFDASAGSPLWIKGIHSFQNCTYSEILAEMSSVFDLRLEIRGRWAKKERCTGKFHEADGVESMLGTLQIIRDFSYQWDPNTRELIIN